LYIRTESATPAKNARATKNIGGRGFCTRIGADFWVEKEKIGLKIVVKSGILHY